MLIYQTTEVLFSTIIIIII